MTHQNDVSSVPFLVSCPATPSSSCDPSLMCQVSSLLCTQHSSSQRWLHIRLTQGAFKLLMPEALIPDKFNQYLYEWGFVWVWVLEGCVLFVFSLIET